MALLLPAKLWRTLSGGGVRHWLHDHVHVRTIRDWTHAPSLFDAAVYPSLLVAERPVSYLATPGTRTPVHSTTRPPVHISIVDRRDHRSFHIRSEALSLDGDPSAPWLLLPPAVRSAFDALRAAGPALGDSSLGRPTLGVKCGCNAAFLVRAIEHDDDTATIFANGRTATIERTMLRPALRGEDVGRVGQVTDPHGDLRIIWTHGPDGLPLRTLPPAAARWLAHSRRRLEQRKDARARQPWWTLFRTGAARHERARVVWADISRQLHPHVLAAGDPTVPLNSCYAMHTTSPDDAWALSTLLASPLATAWFAALAEPARGGFHRYMGWTVATLPVPRQWISVRTMLAAYARRNPAHTASSTREYLELMCRVYDLPADSVLPFVQWGLK